MFRFWESELLSCYAVDLDPAPPKPVDDVDDDDDDDDHPADEGWSEDAGGGDGGARAGP